MHYYAALIVVILMPLPQSKKLISLPYCTSTEIIIIRKLTANSASPNDPSTLSPYSNLNYANDFSSR